MAGFPRGGGGSGTVTSVSSANSAIAVATPTTTPKMTLATLDVIATDGPPAAAVALNAQKITGLANGSAPTDAAAYGQIGISVVVKRYLNKPTTGITVTSTTLAAFSTAWQITGVVVAAGQDVLLDADVNWSASQANDVLFALFRGATQIGAWLYSGAILGSEQHPTPLRWVDENPGAATYTYEIRACQFTAGTVTVYNSIVSTDTGGGTSIFTAEIYNP